jgi:hypothetical protein
MLEFERVALISDLQYALGWQRNRVKKRLKEFSGGWATKHVESQ